MARWVVSEDIAVQVKGVTYCGTSNSGDKSGLTMNSVPWHEEARIHLTIRAGYSQSGWVQVVEFTQTLCSQLEGNYQVASEHAHSCCVLIANTKFKKQGEWHTWIDYDRFHELVAQKVDFCSLDYMAKTPEWACFGHPAQGFAPYETRHHRKGHKDEPVTGGC